MRRAALPGRSAFAVVIMTILGLVAGPQVRPGVAADGTDWLPDLAMARPLDLRLERSADGRRRLRFTTTIVNIGDGPFETRSTRRSVREASMPVKQRIYDSAGGYRVVTTPALATYSGDGHDHWHVQRVATYGLYDAANVLGPVARSSKVGLCFFDTGPYRLSLPDAPSSRRYGQGGCGSRSTLSLKHGISVGWADRYGWELRYQSIDVTRLPAGEYLLKVTVDQNGYFVEGSVTNNCNWTRFRLPSSGNPVTVLGWGAGCTLPGAAPTPTPTPTPALTPTPGPVPTPTPGVTPTPMAMARTGGSR